MPNIQDVAIFGESHSMLGQIVVAKVVLQQDETLESVKKRIRQACQRHLAAYKVPTKVILADSPLHNSRQKKIRKE
jgi:acyl-CoA synthetase (AMP-forming)/AMP-acid ligase II